MSVRVEDHVRVTRLEARFAGVEGRVVRIARPHSYAVLSVTHVPTAVGDRVDPRFELQVHLEALEPASAPPRPAPCRAGSRCKRRHYTCDGCHRDVHDVRACGRDANGEPDAPDLCIACRRRGPSAAEKHAAWAASMGVDS